MKQKIKDKINNALQGLSQQQAYDTICEYKEKLADIYPMIERKEELFIKELKAFLLETEGVEFDCWEEQLNELISKHFTHFFNK